MLFERLALQRGWKLFCGLWLTKSSTLMICSKGSRLVGFYLLQCACCASKLLSPDHLLIHCPFTWLAWNWMLWEFTTSLCLRDKIENWLKAFSVWRLRNRGNWSLWLFGWLGMLQFFISKWTLLCLATVKKMFLISE